MLRTYALYQHSKKVLGFLIFLYLVHRLVGVTLVLLIEPYSCYQALRFGLLRFS